MKRNLAIAALTAALGLSTSQAAAQPFLQLVDPGLLSGDFIDCVQQIEPNDTSNPAGCNTAADVPTFVRFIARGMSEQSYTLQHLSLQGSALSPGAEGFNVGLQLKTFPFGTVENLVGKTENTSFSPVLPTFELSYVDRGPVWTWGMGFSAVPPVPAGGALARVLGISGSLARPLGQTLTLGAELDATLGQVDAPVVATPEQYEAGDLTNIDEDRYQAVCAPQEFGCLDTLSLAHLNARVGLLWHASDAAQPYMKVGLLRFDETFDVQVDLSKWRLRGTLPTAAVGVHLNMNKRLRAAAGVSAAYRPQTLYESGPPMLYRVEAGLSYVL